MNEMEIICIVFAVLASLGAGAVVMWQRSQTKKTLQSLQTMLDEAIRGDFKESQYDESMLSAVETRLAHYLSASVASAQNLMEEKDKIKELIADISHQTKTPVSNILLYAQLLAEQPLTGQSKACVTALNAQAEKLNFLIESLVKVSRLETGIFTLAPRINPVQPLMETAAKQIMPKALEKKLSLQIEEAGDLTAFFDNKWMAEALCNLLDNAIKYTPEGGSVRLKATAYALFVRIDVFDSGIGIPENEQEKIFGRFYRGLAVRETEGVGIGLYLTRQIITGENGYLKVASSPGKETVFSVFLPREASSK